MKNKIFENLFVLELATNHRGSLDRGIQIVREFHKITSKYKDIKFAMKLQFRDVDNFVHKGFKDRKDLRYINATLSKRMKKEDYIKLAKEIKNKDYILMATPFDEASVDFCVDVGVKIIKIASSDINDGPLIKKILETKLPTIVSTAGASTLDIDIISKIFKAEGIPLAINHCSAVYPTPMNELNLNQIDFLKNRYPDNVIGYSTHEYNDILEISIHSVYSKGVTLFEKHIDIDSDNIKISPYCSTPDNISKWLDEFLRAKNICGCASLSKERKLITEKEIIYLDALVRGVYARKDLKAGEPLTKENIYLAIPLQKGQYSCREILNSEVLTKAVKKDAPIMLDSVDIFSSLNEPTIEKINNRGI